MNSYVNTSRRVTSLPVGPSFPEAPRHFCEYRSTLKGRMVNLAFFLSSVFHPLLSYNCGDRKQIFWSKAQMPHLWLSLRHPVVVLAFPQRIRSDIPLCRNENWSQDVTQIAQGGREKGPQGAILETWILQELRDGDVSAARERDMGELLLMA